ncbi:hypothetical protein BDZ97DRAFT_2060208 [Flammula alnicola]|nr:hypothetical protein BDZ97DRAFT_2060208 [Flammula alnicola]
MSHVDPAGSRGMPPRDAQIHKERWHWRCSGSEGCGNGGKRFVVRVQSCCCCCRPSLAYRNNGGSSLVAGPPRHIKRAAAVSDRQSKADRAAGGRLTVAGGCQSSVLAVVRARGVHAYGRPSSLLVFTRSPSLLAIAVCGRCPRCAHRCCSSSKDASNIASWAEMQETDRVNLLSASDMALSPDRTMM